MPKKRSLFDRLFDKAIIQPNGCWDFCGTRRGGYGRIKNENDILKTAHCVAYDLCVGDIPEGMKVLHTCDNPSCVNPDHLFLGTQQDNVDDMINKGRKVICSSEYNGGAKLSLEDVLYIRSSEDSYQTLATKYGLHWKTISRVKRGLTWRDA